MYKYLLFFLLISAHCSAQVISISPAEQFQGQTVSVIIKLAPGVIQAGNPPADSFDVYIQAGATRINCDDFTPAQIFPGTAPYTDSLSADFSIPAGAPPGWYDVHVTTYTLGMVPVDNILANAFVVRLPGSCPVPSGVQSSAVTGTKATISWSPSVTADTFRVRYREIGTTNYIYKDTSGTGGVTSTNLNGLMPGITYLVDVSTICTGIKSTYSLPLDTFTTATQPINCVIPYSIVYSAITSSSVTINWNTNVASDTFRIRYRLTGTSPYLYRNVNGSSHSVTINNLQPDTSYSFQVSSVCNGAGNGYSPVQVIHTLASPVNCVIPFGVSSSAITNTSALISWSTMITADTFRIRYSVNGTTNYFYKDVAGGAGSSTTISGLLPGTTYQYRVSSKCSGVGTGYSPALTFATTNTPVNCTAIPFGLSASGITNASATITWSNLVTADSFLVRYSVTGTTNYIWKMVSGNSTTLTGLSPVTSYQWQVRTKCNAAPPTTYSAPDTFNTPLRMAGIAQEDASFRVYPNPSGGNYTIEFPSGNSRQADLIVTDNTGRIVFSQQLITMEGINTVDLSLFHLSSGVYHLLIRGEEINLRRQLVLQQR